MVTPANIRMSPLFIKNNQNIYFNSFIVIDIVLTNRNGSKLFKKLKFFVLNSRQLHNKIGKFEPNQYGYDLLVGGLYAMKKHSAMNKKNYLR